MVPVPWDPWQVPGQHDVHAFARFMSELPALTLQACVSVLVSHTNLSCVLPDASDHCIHIHLQVVLTCEQGVSTGDCTDLADSAVILYLPIAEDIPPAGPDSEV